MSIKPGAQAPGSSAKRILARGAGDRSQDTFFTKRLALYPKLNALAVPLKAVARFAGSTHLRSRSWGLRPRLYAAARSAGL